MARNLNNVLTYVDGDIYVAPKGTTGPIIAAENDLTSLGSTPGFSLIGWLETSGVSTSTSASQKKINAFQLNQLVKSKYTDGERKFGWTPLERNGLVLSIMGNTTYAETGLGTNVFEADVSGEVEAYESAMIVDLITDDNKHEVFVCPSVSTIHTGDVARAYGELPTPQFESTIIGAYKHFVQAASGDFVIAPAA